MLWFVPGVSGSAVEEWGIHEANRSPGPGIPFPGRGSEAPFPETILPARENGPASRGFKSLKVNDLLGALAQFDGSSVGATCL